MRAVVIENPGVQVNLAWREVEDPTPGNGEILVRVAATLSAASRGEAMPRPYPATPRVATIPRGHAPPGSTRRWRE